MRLPAHTELPALPEPAVRALVLHVRAGGLGLAAGHSVRRSCPSLFHLLGPRPLRLACGECVVTYACTWGPWDPLLLCGPF